MILTENKNMILLKNFYTKQLKEVKNHGIKIVFSKLKTLIKLILVAIPSLIIVLFIRIISPLILIKLQSLDMGRIGEQILTWYVKLKKVGELNSKRTIHLFYIYNSTNYVNTQWLKMWKQHFIILPTFIFKYVVFINSFFPGYEKYEFPPLQVFHRQLIGRKQTDDYDNEPNLLERQQKYLASLKQDSLQNIMKVQEPLIHFSNKELKIGENYLKKIGTKENKFICFTARDKAFLNKHNKDIDWSYQDFRNSDINTYLPAIDQITKKNIFCLRTGFAVEKKLDSPNKKIIDYANSNDRSDFLDIFLGSKCRFYLLSGSGISQIPQAFNKPIVFVNHYNINEILAFAHNSLYIPKKYFLIKEQRLLTFKEFIDLEIRTNFTQINKNNLFKNQTFSNFGIKIIDNTPEEITEVVMEMEARLNGIWKIDNEEKELQDKFWSLFKNKLSLYENISYLKSPTFRIGSSFLKKNKLLLN